ncbi:MAG: glycerol kinase GlpK [Pseudomonadota bacterium]
MKHILALDQGTTSSRAILFAEDGSVRAQAQMEFRQIYPHPGWVEHDPEEIWASQLGVARRALAQAGLKAADITALGIANQRETVIVWERKSGQPVHNAIVWQDRRTADACAGLKRRGKTNIVRSKTGLVIDPYFSATKLAWLLDSVPGLRLHAERGELAFGTVDSWLAWKLSGGSLHITDVSNAARTMLYDIHAGEWDEKLLALFGIPRSLLPRVLPSSRVYGESAKSMFGAPIAIAGIAGDQQAALFGQACHAPGMAKNTYGTGCFLLLNTGAKAVPSKHGLLTTRCAQRGTKPQYALEGGVFIAGAVVQWLRDGLGFIRSSDEIEALAASVEDAGGVYLVPAFAGLGAPHWDAYARGTMLGLTRGTTRAHIARAALEAIAFQSAELLQAMQKDAGIRLQELRVDGGAATNDTLMQFQADILGVPVLRPKVLETTALGAAYLAGLATGVWKNTAAISRQWAVGRRFEPAMSRADAQARMSGWTRALERSKNWIEP